MVACRARAVGGRKRAPFSKKGFEFTKSQKGKVDGFPLRFTLEQTEGDRRIKPAVADQSSGPAAQIHHRGSTLYTHKSGMF